ncbi:alpha-keto acid decarboxylase family protein [Kineococcus sp. LSe6-4]|uniref:Alpha-keto-acid decarboxylase n=1 Tax=Kineococcus halophytocola TaxID=3234027 RepID=A0ABV4H3D5_9ACTN
MTSRTTSSSTSPSTSSSTSSSTPPTVTVGAYLAHRLVELGGAHLFGLPGDFNLALLDEMLQVPGIEWVGNTNELNAAYATDAYARTTRGVAALVTTYGVGELSAVNGIAGSYAEDVPVVQVTGMPETGACQRGALLHHSLVDGDHEHFARAYREVTATGAVLRAADAALEIDRVLRVALERSKPVYLGVPADVALAHVSSAPLRRPLRPAPSDPVALQDLRTALAEVLAGVPSLTVLAGTQVHRRRAEGGLAALADRDGVRVATLVGAKAMLPEQHPASLGTYQGALTISPDVREAVDGADLLVLAGAVLSDVMTGLFSHGFDPARALRLGIADAVVDGVTFHDVRLEDTLPLLAEVAGERAFAALDPVEAAWPHVGPGEHRDTGAADAPLTQHTLWRTVQGWLPEDAIVLADAGTSLYGTLELRLPPGAELLLQPIWSSIGFTVPALLGTCLAAPQRRSVLFVGDGAAQLTVQEVATVLQRETVPGRPAPVVVVVDNAGYTIERVLRSPRAVYQDVTAWDWLALPALFAPGRDVLTARAGTGAELQDALTRIAADPGRPAVLHAVLDAADVPPLLARLGRAVASGPGEAVR